MPAASRVFFGSIALSLCMVTLPIAARGESFVETYHPVTGKLQTIRRVTEPVRPAIGATPMSRGAVESAALAFVAREKATLGVTDPNEWTAASTREDKVGYQHVRLLQTHEGLPVLGAEIYLHFDTTGEVFLAGLKVPAAFPASASPTISDLDAGQIALDAATDEVPGFEIEESGAPRLVWLPLGIVENSNAATHLAWEVRVVDVAHGGDGYSTRHYVDAGSGEPVLALSDLQHLDRRVYDCALYEGQLPGCQIDWRNGVYPPYNYYNGRSEGMPPRGPNPAYDWPYYYGSTDVDSLYSLLGQVHAFVGARLGLSGGNNQGGTGFGSVPVTQTRGFAHVDPAVTYCPNSGAFNTTNGNVNLCRGMVVPDVVAHEYGHSLAFHSIENGSGTAIGAIYLGQTGSLNEAFADIHAESFECWRNGANDFKFGITSSNGIFRDLADPPSVTRRYDNLPFPDRFYHPNVYCGTTLDNGGVHMNSTVVSHAFYLFAMGGTKNGCTIAGQGVEKMLPVFHRAWENYFPQACTFNEAYTYLLQACSDLYPSSVTDELQKALQAVELDQPGLCSGTPEQPAPCSLVSAVPDRPGPAGGRLHLSLSPNPVRTTARFDLALQVAGPLRVGIYDVTGALVRELADDWRAAGPHVLTWDTRDGAGRPVPSGLYYARAVIEGERVSRPLVVAH